MYKAIFYVDDDIFTFLSVPQDRPEELEDTTTAMTDTSLKPDT